MATSDTGSIKEESWFKCATWSQSQFPKQVYPKPFEYFIHQNKDGKSGLEGSRHPIHIQSVLWLQGETLGNKYSSIHAQKNISLSAGWNSVAWFMQIRPQCCNLTVK